MSRGRGGGANVSYAATREQRRERWFERRRLEGERRLERRRLEEMSSTMLGKSMLQVRWCGVVVCGVVWCDVAWCGVAWCDMMQQPPGFHSSFRVDRTKHPPQRPAAPPLTPHLPPRTLPPHFSRCNLAGEEAQRIRYQRMQSQRTLTPRLVERFRQSVEKKEGRRTRGRRWGGCRSSPIPLLSLHRHLARCKAKCRADHLTR